MSSPIFMGKANDNVFDEIMHFYAWAADFAIEMLSIWHSRASGSSTCQCIMQHALQHEYHKYGVQAHTRMMRNHHHGILQALVGPHISRRCCPT